MESIKPGDGYKHHLSFKCLLWDIFIDNDSFGIILNPSYPFHEVIQMINWSRRAYETL